MTNKEIAKQLGISQATLSLVINNKPGLSDATRQRVLSQLISGGFQHLIKEDFVAPGTSRNIAFVVYKCNGTILDLHPFFVLLLESIGNRAQHYEYNVIVRILDQRNPILPQLENIDKLDINGIIFFGTEMDYESLKNTNVLHHPFVIMDNDFSWENVNTVSIHNEMGTYQAIEHFPRKSHYP